ncbi:ParB/RepB/Spo0J family partition protein [Gluconobacter japonicus]|uniref:ParB/RepB/Spo0J family partition protein n=1 Tax=Gluconobacter japonicus TaxID=376620 RepID=UPI0039E93D8E
MSDPTNPHILAQRTKGTRSKAIKKVALPKISTCRTRLTESLEAGKIHRVALDENAFYVHLAFQTRAKTEKNPTGLHAGNVRDLRTAIRSEAELPPVELARFHDKASGVKACFLIAGFHRIEAYRQAGVGVVPAIITDMTKKEALAKSAASNATHGQRLSKQDRRTSLNAFLLSGGWKEADGTPKRYAQIALQGTGGTVSKHTVRNWIEKDHPEIFKAIAAHWRSEGVEAEKEQPVFEREPRDFEGEARGYLQAILELVQMASDIGDEKSAQAIAVAMENTTKKAWTRMPRDEFEDELKVDIAF